MDNSTLTQTASIIAAFGAAGVIFRIQRERAMAELGEPQWIARADWLLVLATMLCLLLVVVPLMLFPQTTASTIVLARGVCAASAILVSGWVLAILAHYRLILRGSRSGPRDNPEPDERALFYVSILLAILAFSFIVLN